MCFNGAATKKGVSPVTEKIQKKPVKYASFVGLSSSDPPVTSIHSNVDCIIVGSRLGSKGLESKDCFDNKGGIHA